MSYKDFQNRVNALIKRAGGGIDVGFSNDTEKGIYYATCSDDTVIVGNSQNLKVTVNFGSGHKALATI